MKLKKFKLTCFGVLLLQAAKRNAKVREKDCQKKSELDVSFLSLIKISRSSDTCSFRKWLKLFLMLFSKTVCYHFLVEITALVAAESCGPGTQVCVLSRSVHCQPIWSVATYKLPCEAAEMKLSSPPVVGHNLTFLCSVVLTSPEKDIWSCLHSHSFDNR